MPELHALVNTIALIICGTTLTLARCAAMRKGDCVAVPVLLSSIGSFEGTSNVTIKIDITDA